MKKTRIAFIFLLLLVSGLVLCAVLPQRNPVPQSEKRRAILQLMVSGIEAEHFRPVPVNDSLSKRIYTLYLKRLNRDKLYFTQEDINKFKPYEYKLDSAISQGTFEFFDLVNGIFDKRLGEDSVYAKEILSKPFDYTVNETIQTDPDKAPFPKNMEELHERWRKIIKYETLGKLVDIMNAQEKGIKKKDSTFDETTFDRTSIYSFDQGKRDALAKAVMAHESEKDKKDTAFKIKTFAEMEAEARSKELKVYENYFKDFKAVSDTDKVTEFFDVISNCFDPHTEYFAPEEGKNFEISMSGQLEGIGAQLQDKSGNITIEKVIPGSPAWKSGELKEGDVFLKVAQGNAEPVDIEGMRLDKAVQLIRGKKGTEVKLTVKSGTTTKVVSLIRDVIHLEDTYAHAAVIDNNGQKMGYIRLPEFYTDFSGNGGRRCSDDVKELVKELEADQVKGIIIDLRDNGGGSLQDVVRMAGIFVPRGPIVQIKSRNSETPKTMSSTDTAVFYKGPLLVMVNGASASASEIFAAAMQDYKRGIIMGSQTYGKGTVQQIFTLDDKLSPAYNSLKPLGSVKITISKFYRINGGTTQKDGVIPDVMMPDPYQYLYEKEKDADYPLSWDKITPASYKEWIHPSDVKYLSDESVKRTGNDSIFNLIRDEAKNFKMERDSTLYSLNLETFRKAEKLRTDANKRFDAISKTLPFEKILHVEGVKGSRSDSTDYPPIANKGDHSPNLIAGNFKVFLSATSIEKDKMRADTNEAKSENLWLKKLTKDPELFEATRVVGDMK
ncbi:MAG TPA: carboxy terminal-processing peptidase [Bacteroidia bacterium]|nr:carboxy terminal-processing peptidase [Bacteroidia bacterium]